MRRGRKRLAIPYIIKGTSQSASALLPTTAAATLHSHWLSDLASHPLSASLLSLASSPLLAGLETSLGWRLERRENATWRSICAPANHCPFLPISSPVAYHIFRFQRVLLPAIPDSGLFADSGLSTAFAPAIADCSLTVRPIHAHSHHSMFPFGHHHLSTSLTEESRLPSSTRANYSYKMLIRIAFLAPFESHSPMIRNPSRVSSSNQN